MVEEREETYRREAGRYLENAFGALMEGELTKASEFLWGSMAEALKAVAARKGYLLRSHSELRNYARQLARELGDRQLEDAFIRADRLHANFYESFLSDQDLAADAEEIRLAVGKLLDLLETAT